MMSTTPVLPVEVYGFLGWITSSTFYVVFLVWAFTPDFILQWYGITYYPSKYWAIALPTWLCVTVVCVTLAYMWYVLVCVCVSICRNACDSLVLLMQFEFHARGEHQLDKRTR